MEEKEVKKTKSTGKAAETKAPAAKKTEAKATAEKKPAAKKPAAEKAAPAKKEAPKKAPKEETKPAPEVEIEEDEDDEIIELISEDGETKKFYHVATIDYENEWYVFFQPADKMDDADEDEVMVFKLDSDENDNDIFMPVQSEELLHKVYAEYVRVMNEHEHDCGGGEGGCSGGCSGCSGGCK